MRNSVSSPACPVLKSGWIYDMQGEAIATTRLSRVTRKISYSDSTKGLENFLSRSCALP